MAKGRPHGHIAQTHRETVTMYSQPRVKIHMAQAVGEAQGGRGVGLRNHLCPSVPLATRLY